MNPKNDLSVELQKFISDHFQGYEFPYEDSDAHIRKMNYDDRQEYCLRAGAIAENDVWKTELQGMLRHYFSHLAFKASSEKLWSEVDAYRLAILMLQEFDKRLRTLGSAAKNPMKLVSKELQDREKLDIFVKEK